MNTSGDFTSFTYPGDPTFRGALDPMGGLHAQAMYNPAGPKLPCPPPGLDRTTIPGSFPLLPPLDAFLSVAMASAPSRGATPDRVVPSSLVSGGDLLSSAEGGLNALGTIFDWSLATIRPSLSPYDAMASALRAAADGRWGATVAADLIPAGSASLGSPELYPANPNGGALYLGGGILPASPNSTVLPGIPTAGLIISLPVNNTDLQNFVRSLMIVPFWLASIVDGTQVATAAGSYPINRSLATIALLQIGIRISGVTAAAGPFDISRSYAGSFRIAGTSNLTLLAPFGTAVSGLYMPSAQDASSLLPRFAPADTMSIDIYFSSVGLGPAPVLSLSTLSGGSSALNALLRPEVTLC